MIHSIRTSKVSKVMASYLAIQLILTTVQPSRIFALTSGPSQPEFNAFTPIGTSDMVDLSTGNFNYNIPIMDVGGYPLNLAYDSGITMDQEASWVGLGWNLNVGQINRQVRGIPDDFKGDIMTYKRNMKPNKTVSISAQFSGQTFGIETEDFTGSLGMGISYNNYAGVSFKPSYGLAFDLGDFVNVGMNVQTSTTEGATISPNINAKFKEGELFDRAVTGRLNAGVSFNSNRGLANYGLGLSAVAKDMFEINNKKFIMPGTGRSMGGLSGNISFSGHTITPRKRTAFIDRNSTFTISAGGHLFGVDGEIELSASATTQTIRDNERKEKAYGYEFTGLASKNDILDYNRENDRVISKSLQALPYTNYTYDLYSVNGQGINGMFRPHRSKIGQIYDEFVQDESESESLGVEAEGGAGWHAGANFVKAPSKSYTGVWQTRASNTFKNDDENSPNHSNLAYEPVYFKYVGENKVDDKHSQFVNSLKGDYAVALTTGGTDFDRYAKNEFKVKRYQGTTKIPVKHYETIAEPIQREERDVRNQSVQKISAKELPQFYSDDYAKTRINDHAKDHHTAEIRILKPDGSTYVFGETAYNTDKQEVTFATNSTQFNCATGIVKYNANENSEENTSGIDHFYDNVKTPPYAHTYLISAVLSADYEDITGNGPSTDDLGAYTLFEYEALPQEFQWRIPFGEGEASYNAGFNSHEKDQKGSYIYGQKEVKYIKKIETKTHVAIFELSDRQDAVSVKDEDGGAGNERLQKIDNIKLYAKEEYDKLINDPNAQGISPIKTAHFEYDYSNCKDLPSHINYNPSHATNLDGKLTLKKIYFTYRNSKMGKYTPYTFNYDGFNPAYQLKAFDIWGNYKPNNGGCATQDPITTSEYPFVDQDDRTTQDRYAGAWALTSIGLPSGGSIDLTYESDDYQYVQDKHTMRMFKVAGAGAVSNPGTATLNQMLYGTNEAKYLYVELPADETLTTKEAFQQKYLKEMTGKPVYFRFLMNMTKTGQASAFSRDYDYVTGYFNIDSAAPLTIFTGQNGRTHVSIPMMWTQLEGITGSSDTNPITKAGLYFGRTYMNGIVYDQSPDKQPEDVASIAKKLRNSINDIGDIFKGPHKKLRSNSFLCARRFIPEKSWIRLSNPKPYKLGGGSRIKKLVMSDDWDDMTTSGIEQTYGQTYKYTLEDNSSSGVATFEPNDSAENPFVEPFYDHDDNSKLVDRIAAPRDVSYVEKPFGKAFFPYSKVTYSRVTVKNLERTDITRHATGHVVTEFYTTKDFPTKVDYTDIELYFDDNEPDVLRNIIGGLFGLPVHVKKEFTLSQGYMIHTNDMDGKMRMQKVYPEGAKDPISTVEYIYSKKAGAENELSNVLPVISKDGTVRDREIGVDYDLITDFRESYSQSETKGVNTNVAAFLLGIWPVVVPTAFPVSTEHENTAHSVITTKTVHTTAILKEKIATDLGATVSTINKAWDAETGAVILTETKNEYDDAYYNFNFPAYWAYNTMGQASQNLGLKGQLNYAGGYFSLAGVSDASTYLTLGDELMTIDGNANERYWVVAFNNDKSGVSLMNRGGSILNDSNEQSINFKIMRSGYRNQHMGNMGAVTLMKNPLPAKNTSTSDPYDYAASINTNTFKQNHDVTPANSLRIVNASAVAYNDTWNCQCENGLPYVPNVTPESDAVIPIEDYPFNPYVYNAKGEWRADKSYAYLTERVDVKNTTTTRKHTRKEGYFKAFTPFYASGATGWEFNPNAINQIDTNSGPWTAASEVTQYSPYGAEIENKDALDRYSSAQYGYNFTLPTAVASNSEYRNMAADNFEDYAFSNTTNGHFNFKTNVDDDGDGGLAISTDQAHTGYSSLLIPSQDKAEKEIPLLGVIRDEDDFDGDKIPNEEDKCPHTRSKDQTDYDEDNIGDICDDDPIPTIDDAIITKQISWWRKQTIFSIQGAPNDIVRCAVFEVKRGSHGWKASFNGGEQFTTPKIFDVQLDATGKASAMFEMGVNAPDKRKDRAQHNVTIVALALYHKSVDLGLVKSPPVVISVKGFKKPDSGQEHGSFQIFPTKL